MPVDPQAQAVLDAVIASGAPPLEQLSPEAARQNMREATRALGEPVAVAAIEDRQIPGPDSEIPVRIYRPALESAVGKSSAGEPLPVVVFYHGGGWVIGGVDTHDGYCRALANAAPAIVVSVEYRLAPEHPAPAAAEDAWAAADWAARNAEKLGGRSDRVCVAGDSAGGNLAAAAALLLRDRQGPQLHRQVLIYPIVDHDFETDSYRQFADGYYLTRAAMRWFWDNYCPRSEERSRPELSPLRAENLCGLPPTLVLTAECDPLRDEGHHYARRLADAGVPVTYSQYDGMIHGFIRRLDAIDKARDALAEVAEAVR